MARQIIVDPSALIAFFVGSEKNHGVAVKYVEANADGQWLVLETVFHETVTWFRARLSVKDSIKIGTILRNDHAYFNISDEVDAATWEIFRRFDDKSWSYTDCSMLAAAQKLGLTEIFTFDHHIKQMATLGVLAVP